MFNLDALLRFINVNGDEVIQKSEVEDFVAKQQSPSIFSNYFNSMSGDVDNDTFFKDMYNIMEKAKTEKNQEPELNFADEKDSAKFQKLCAEEQQLVKNAILDRKEEIYEAFSSKIATREEFETIFNQFMKEILDKGEHFSAIYDKFDEKFGFNKINLKRDENGYFPYNVNNDPPEIIEELGGLKLRNGCCYDVRGYDITQLELTDEQLLNLTIDKTTVMTSEQKAILEPYMEAMKNPGLGIRQLHEQGFTGKGVKMAIIDGPLGMHEEYKDNIVGEVRDINSEELGGDCMFASMHGAAVISIAAGKNTGVAPDAGVVYYSAANISKDPEDIKTYRERFQQEMNVNIDDPESVNELENALKDFDTQGYCISNMPDVEAINRILDENEKLPENERVSVVSISWGFDELAPGYEELQQAVQRAKEQGVFIVSTELAAHYGFYTNGANRSPVGDVDSPECYEAGAWWKNKPESSIESLNGADKDKLLLFPMDHRTVADFTDSTSYRYEGNDGGMSWSTPWVAGMYVLAKQADPSITPEKFWQYALETSSECRNNDSGEYVGRLINPQGLIQKILENKGVE